MRDQVDARNLVHGEIDATNLRRSFGAPGMASAAERPLEGLLRYMRSRLHFVFRLHFVAGLAVEDLVERVKVSPRH